MRDNEASHCEKRSRDDVNEAKQLKKKKKLNHILLALSLFKFTIYYGKKEPCKVGLCNLRQCFPIKGTEVTTALHRFRLQQI